MIRHTFVGSTTSALVQFALIVILAHVGATDARLQTAAPEKPQGEASNDGLEQLRRKV
jgi:hypothetical protein